MIEAPEGRHNICGQIATLSLCHPLRGLGILSLIPRVTLAVRFTRGYYLSPLRGWRRRPP